MGQTCGLRLDGESEKRWMVECWEWTVGKTGWIVGNTHGTKHKSPTGIATSRASPRDTP